MLAVLSSAEKEMIDIFKSNVDFTLLHNTLNFLWFRNNMFEGFGSIFRPTAHTGAVVHLNNLIRQLHCTAVYYYIQGELHFLHCALKCTIAQFSVLNVHNAVHSLCTMQCTNVRACQLHNSIGGCSIS